jgi:cob(I)alamin adenosyltransferase
MPDTPWFTGRGDDGFTGLLGPDRVPKYDPRPDAYGTVDEAQAALGLVRAGGCAPRTAEILLDVQRDLYPLMAELAAAGEGDSPFRGAITPGHVERLEAWLAEVQAGLEVPREFVVPGDSQAGAALHLARTVVRRAERAAVRLHHQGPLANERVLGYLNRLSSLLFVLACAEDQAATAHAPTRAKGAHSSLPPAGRAAGRPGTEGGYV